MSTKILVIDDSDIALQWVSTTLSPLGFEVSTSNTPYGNQPIITKRRPDLILLDVSMPGLSGDMLCKMLKKNPLTKDTIIALYSSLPEQELKRLTQESLADGYIMKTEDSQQLKEQINQLLAKLVPPSKILQGAGSAIKITVIDDSPIVLFWALHNLAPYGFDVSTCQEPMGAEDVIKSAKPELILLDVRMPMQSGDLLCKLLKSNPKTKDILVILYSELPEDELRRMAKESRADGYIQKTENVEELAAKINQFIGKRRGPTLPI